MAHKPINVLLIEDNPGDARLIREMLVETDGARFELECADRLSAGLERLAKGGIDCVLLDLTLPDSHELDTFERVQAQAQAQAQAPGIPIVVISGLDDEALAIEAVQRGAQDYLVKSYLGSYVLARTIRYAIERKRMAEELKRYREHLEELVEERTAEVLQINSALQAEIAERIKNAEKLKNAYARLERQSVILAQQAKMSAIGVLVAGVAHELNNPLMAMLHFAQYCLKHIAEDDLIYTVLQDIKHETRRCIDIVKNLLTFSYSGDGRKEKYELKNPSEIVERVVRLLSYRIEKEGVSITSHVDEETPKVRMHVNAMQDAILNLLTNALDALEESKKKEVRIDVRPDGDGVRFSIADSGIGISPEVIGNIYDPFFTTKPVGRGTGLGLSLCQGVIQAHGGEITCESEPGKGAVFHVYIPTQRRKGAKRDEAHFSDRR